MRDGVTMLRCTHDVHSQSVHVRRRSGKSPSFGFSQVVMYAYLCVPLPILSLSGSIAMIAFRHPSRFWARALGRARVVSDRSALGPSTSVWALHEVSQLHRCYMFCYVRFVSSHHMAIPRKAFLGDIRGDRLDHRIAPELFISDSVFPCFALNPS